MSSSPLGSVARGAVLALGFVSLLSVSASAASRTVTTPVEGLRDASPRVHALVGGRIITAPGQVIENGTLVLRDGVIEAVGADVKAPADARVWDVSGKTLYAGFIESGSTLFLPEAWKPAAPRGDDGPPAAAAPAAPAPRTGAPAWNSRVTPERSAFRALAPDTKGAEKLRALGFTAANVAPARGIFRGAGALVGTGTIGFNAGVVRPATAQELGVELGSFLDRSYPTSLMGALALIRQTLLDAQWYAAAQAAYAASPAGRERPETNESLAALAPVIAGAQTILFETTDELDVPRALGLAAEFKLKLALRGNGTEYRVRDLLAAAKVPVVLPLDFPEVPEVEVSEKAVDVQLHELQHWELAPANAARLAEAGVPIAFTTAKLKKPETEFWARVRKTVARGLTPDAALAALTTTPAGMLGAGATHGTLEAGRVANVVVASGDLFKSDDAAIELVCVDGDVFEQETWERLDVRGSWKLEWTGAKGPETLEIRGAKANRPQVKAGDKAVPASLADKNTLLLFASAELFGGTTGTVRLSATGQGGELTGTGELPDGTALRWTAKRTAPFKPEAPKPDAKPAPEEKFFATANVYPAGAYGRAGLPEQPAVLLVKNATIWTSGPAGILESADLLVRAGKIEQVGKNLAAPAGATVIDATGKHVTAGLIDCHSHTAVNRGINEGASAITVEVRIGDVIDATDIGLYRELAGGTTTANVLHGSSNPMGGQNQVIKLRWGAGAEALKFAGAQPGVKFALGENVVRANFGATRTRYPMSRMGVPEIMLDTFNRAREYGAAWDAFKAGKTTAAPRRDLRLEAALEILKGDRLVHIHSYRSDEILAFIKLAEQLKLNVGTFQHILEGYKVAPEIAKIGAGGSSFSDWWGYKFEVFDAIPYNGALMTWGGVNVSFNSDSDELARRLNTEAAKAVKYGGIAPAEALKFVTINPAKQLRIDKQVGSLEPGKDADFVIWNASPLSTAARPDSTWIDGRRYFDRDEDKQLRAKAATERAALLQKALAERTKALARPGGGEDGGGGPPPTFSISIREALAARFSHDANDEFRAIYHNGGNAHTCSLQDGGRR